MQMFKCLPTAPPGSQWSATRMRAILSESQLIQLALVFLTNWNVVGVVTKAAIIVSQLRDFSSQARTSSFNLLMWDRCDIIVIFHQLMDDTRQFLQLPSGCCITSRVFCLLRSSSRISSYH